MPPPSRLDQLLVKKAAHAIIQKHNQDAASRPSLFDDEGNVIIVQLQLLKPFPKDSYRPVRVKIPHSLYGNGALEYSICYFCCTNFKEEIEAYLRDNKIEGLDRVLSMKDVQKQYKSYNDMKKLFREYTHFICDAAIVRQLYNFLGPVFGAKHRMPVQIHSTKTADLPREVNKVVQSSFIHLGGDNISLRIGHTKQTAQQVAENVVVGVDFLAGKIPSSWSNIQSINMRLAQSAAIPVYSKHENELVDYLQAQVKKQQHAKGSAAAAAATAAATPAKNSSHTDTNHDSNNNNNKNNNNNNKTPAKSAKKAAATATTAATPVAVLPPPAPAAAVEKSGKKAPKTPSTTTTTTTAAVTETAAVLPTPAPKSSKKNTANTTTTTTTTTPVATASAKKTAAVAVAVAATTAVAATEGKKAGARPTGIPKVQAKKK